MLDVDGIDVDELKRFTKSSYDLDQILSTAKDLKYTREVLRLLTAEWTDPSEAFVPWVIDGTLPGDRRRARSYGRAGRRLCLPTRAGQPPWLGVLSGVRGAGAAGDFARGMGVRGSSCSVPVGCPTPISASSRTLRREKARPEPGRPGRTGGRTVGPPVACRRRWMEGTGPPSGTYRALTKKGRVQTEASPARRRQIRAGLAGRRPAGMEPPRPERRIPNSPRSGRAARLFRTATRRLTSRRQCLLSRWAWTASPAATCSGP